MMEFDELVDRWCSGALDAAQSAALAERIAGDADARSHLRQQAELDALLRAASAADRLRQGVLAELRAQGGSSVARRAVLRRLRSSRRTWLGRGWMLAAVLLLAVAGWLLLTPGQRFADALPVDALVVGPAELHWRDGSRVVLAAGTQVHVAAPAPEVRLDLRSGTVTATVARRAPTTPFTVITRQADVQVVGTVFQVMAADDRTTVAVDAGRVQVRDRAAGRVTEVAAGERLTVAAPPAPPSAAPPSPPTSAASSSAAPAVLRLHFRADRGVISANGRVVSWTDACAGLIARQVGTHLIRQDIIAGRAALVWSGDGGELHLDARDALGDCRHGTIAAWVRGEAAGATVFRPVLSSDTGFNQRPFEFGLRGLSIELWTAPVPVPIDQVSGPRSPATTLRAALPQRSGWRHIAYSAGDRACFFVDGAAVPHRQDGAALSAPPFFAFAADPAALYRIGATGADEWFHGAIADLRVWDQPLTDDDLRRLAAEPPGAVP